MFGAWPGSSFVASRLPAGDLHGLHRYLPYPTPSGHYLHQKHIPISRHVRPVKLTWPGVTYLACNSGHVGRLTWPQGLTWLVTTHIEFFIKYQTLSNYTSRKVFALLSSSTHPMVLITNLLYSDHKIWKLMFQYWNAGACWANTPLVPI